MLSSFIALSDTPSDIREFFLKRGADPNAAPAPDTDQPLIDTDESGLELEGNTEEEKALTFQQRLASMTVPEKVKCASKGTREMRSVLIRDPNRMVAAAVLSCPKVNEAEVEAFAKRDVRKKSCGDRDEPRWTKSSACAGARQELEDAGGTVDQHDAAPQRFRREEAVDRPERAVGPPCFRAPEGGRGPAVAPTPPRVACFHSIRICARPSM